MAIASNTIKINSLVAKAAAKALRNKSVAVSRVRNDVADTYKVAGYKSGDTISIKLPPRYVVGSGSALSKQNTVQTSVTLTLNQKNIGIGFISDALTVTIDSLMQFLEPRMAQLMSQVETDFFSLYYYAQNLATPGAISNGIPAQWTGADINTFRVIADARARLSEKAIPTDDGELFLALAPAANAALTDAVKGLFQPVTEIAAQYKTGLLGTVSGFQAVESQNLPTHTCGTRALGAGAAVDGNQTGSSLLLKSVGNAKTINQGDQFTIAGVYAINPLTRASTGKLQVFTHVGTQQTSSAGGAVTLTISPSINVTAPGETVSAQAADSAAVTWMGDAGYTTQVNLGWHRMAAAVVFMPLTQYFPGADVASEIDPVSGINVRVVTQGQVDTDEVVQRVDLLYGFTVVRGEAMVRLQG